jgi:hypothetical protein
MTGFSRYVFIVALLAAASLSIYSYREFARGDLDRSISVPSNLYGISNGVDLIDLYVNGHNICNVLGVKPIRMTATQLATFLRERQKFFSFAEQSNGTFDIKRQSGFSATVISRMARGTAGCELSPSRYLGLLGIWGIPMVFILALLFSNLTFFRNHREGEQR